MKEFSIIVASRSIEVKDLKDGLTKLSSKAKKAVYLTYKVGGSFVNEEILYESKDAFLASLKWSVGKP